MSDVAGTPVSVHDVAREIRRRQAGVPAVKLHKLCFYCQGHHLGTFGQPLFKDTITAWDMGPVVPELWHGEKTGELPQPKELTEAQLNTVGYVLSRYGGLTGSDLVDLSHGQSPWQRADQKRPPKRSAKIELEWIREHFVGDFEEEEVPLDSGQVRQLLADATQRQAEPVDTGGPGDWDRLVAMREELTNARA